MSFITRNYNWPVQDLSAVATVQQVAAGTEVLLNGALSNPNTRTVDFNNISRTLVFNMSSTGSYSFVITGFRNNEIVTENAVFSSIITSATYTTTNFFDSVISVFAVLSTGAETVTIGTGLVGMTRPFVINSFITSSPVLTAIQTKLLSGSATYNVVGSIEKWYNTKMSGNVITSPSPLYLNQSLTNATQAEYLAADPASASSFITVESLPLTMICVHIASSNASASLSITINTPRLAQ